jgi:hypothetical protein
MINKIGGGKKDLIPIFEGHRGMGKECKTHLYNMAMFTSGSAILLVCMRARHMMGDTNRLKKGI